MKKLLSAVALATAACLPIESAPPGQGLPPAPAALAGR